jgi:ion channel
MVIQLAIGTALIILTVFNHAFFFEIIRNQTTKRSAVMEIKYPRHGDTLIMVFVIVGIFFTHTVEAWIWAMFYWMFADLGSLRDAIYFSTVTYTTLGYGDITLAEKWQLLSAMQAVDGILMFGWSTAFIVIIRSSFWSKKGLNNFRDNQKL